MVEVLGASGQPLDEAEARVTINDVPGYWQGIAGGPQLLRAGPPRRRNANHPIEMTAATRGEMHRAPSTTGLGSGSRIGKCGHRRREREGHQRRRRARAATGNVRRRGRRALVTMSIITLGT